MTFTNSPLVTYTRITNNKTKNRKYAIDTITIHCIVGQWTAKQGCDYFATTDRECSSNYVVGKDGSIGLSVEEKDRAWTSGGNKKVNGISGSENDHRAITIEVASDTKPPYKVTDAAYKALVELLADICKRNNIKELKWKADKNLVGQVDKQNMTVHRWFADKSCPGDYLYNLHGQIAKEVNARLEEPNVIYCVQIGAYSEIANAEKQLKAIKAKGFTDAYIKKVDQWHKVQVGAYSVKENAERMLAKVRKAGFEAFIATMNYYSKYVGTSSDIDAVFKAIGVPEKFRGSWGKRKPVATANGIANYTGTATQNAKLVNLAKVGKLKKVL